MNYLTDVDIYTIFLIHGYWCRDKTSKEASIPLLIPKHANSPTHYIMAGSESAKLFLNSYRVTTEHIRRYKDLPVFRNIENNFWNFLSEIRFNGKFYGLKNCEKFIPGEIFADIRSNVCETFLYRQGVKTILVKEIGYATGLNNFAGNLRGKLLFDLFSVRTIEPFYRQIIINALKNNITAIPPLEKQLGEYFITLLCGGPRSQKFYFPIFEQKLLELNKNAKFQFSVNLSDL